VKERSRPPFWEQSRWMVGCLFVGLANPSPMHAMEVLVRESWWSSNQANLPGSYHLFWMQGGQRALQCSRNAVPWLRVLSNPAYFGIGGRRLTLTVCGGSRKKPQTVANERPATLERVQFGEKTHLYSYNGYGI
jgi:hypothetical protein